MVDIAGGVCGERLVDDAGKRAGPRDRIPQSGSGRSRRDGGKIGASSLSPHFSHPRGVRRFARV